MEVPETNDFAVRFVAVYAAGASVDTNEINPAESAAVAVA
jgi:hypothetical protein